MQKKNRWLIILAPAAVAVVVLLYCFPPGKYRFWPPCVFHKLTGLYCPGCGNTRALAALLHGDIAGSLAKNILLIPALITLAILWCKPKAALNRYFAWTISVVVIVFGVARNLPWYPFTLLAPH